MAMKNFRGLLLTMVALVIFVLIVAEVLTYVALNYNYSAMATASSQESAAATFAQSLNGGYSSVLYQSLHNSIYGLGAYESNAVLTSKQPALNNTATVLANLMYNSSTTGAPTIRNYVGGVNISAYNNYVKASASSQGLTLTLSTPVLSVYQTSPFTINASIQLNATVVYGAQTFKYPVFATASLNLQGAPELLSYIRKYPQPVVPSNATAVLVGNVRAISGSTSPFLFNYGTAVIEPAASPCTSVPSSLRTQNYILVTTNAFNINQSVCGMGGLITYTTNSATPIAPFLVYASASNVVSLIGNGTRVLLSGQSLGTYNVSGLLGVAQNGYYLPSQNAASYLSRGSGQTSSQDQAGSLSFLLANLQTVRFNASKNSYVRITNNAILNTTTNSLTYSFWINGDSWADNPLLLNNLIQGSASPISGVGTWVGPTGVVGFQLRLGNACCQTLYSNNKINTKTWYQVTDVWNGTKMTLYINGVADNSISASGALWVVHDTFIGINGDDFYLGINANQFAGQISNAQIYNAPLTSVQVSQLYREGINGAPIVPANIVGWWPLNGNVNDYLAPSSNTISTNTVFMQASGYDGDSTTGTPLLGYQNFGLTLNCPNPTGCTNSSSQQFGLTTSLAPLVGTFNGINSYVSVGSKAFGTNAVSVSLWGYSNAAQTNGLFNLLYGPGLLIYWGSTLAFPPPPSWGSADITRCTPLSTRSLAANGTT